LIIDFTGSHLVGQQAVAFYYIINIPPGYKAVTLAHYYFVDLASREQCNLAAYGRSCELLSVASLLSYATLAGAGQVALPLFYLTFMAKVVTLR